MIHFNEVDECAGLDALITNRVQAAMGQPVETTLHDVRWGDVDRSGSTGQYVWVFEISGSVPPAHLEGGWAGAESFRQPTMYFSNGDSTICGVSKPDEIVWSRVYIEVNRVAMDFGRGVAIQLPLDETERRWNSTTRQWPIMHGVLYGLSRDQSMARHKANHIQVVYCDDESAADRTMEVKAAMADALGIRVPDDSDTAADHGSHDVPPATHLCPSYGKPCFHVVEEILPSTRLPLAPDAGPTRPRASPRHRTADRGPP